MSKENTVGYLIKQLRKFPRDTIFCISDMDGNNIYGCDISDYSEVGNIELIIPIYLRKIAIEPTSEDDVFINNNVEIEKE